MYGWRNNITKIKKEKIKMRIGLASDHRGYKLKEYLKNTLPN